MWASAPMRREDPGTGVRSRRRLSPVELQLPQLLRACAAARCARSPAPSPRSPSAAPPQRAWALVNASPDILAQLQANPVLQPARAAARHRDRRHRAGGRPDRSHHRSFHAARVHPAAAGLVHRQGARGPDARQPDLQRARPLLRRRAARAARRMAALQVAGVDGRRVARAAGGQQARAVLAAPRARRSRATTWRWCCSDRASGRTAGLRAGPRRDGAARVAAPCSPPTACWWTAPSGPTRR